MSSMIHQSIEKSKSSESITSTNKSVKFNRVRLAIEAIEQNSRNYPRERKS